MEKASVMIREIVSVQAGAFMIADDVLSISSEQFGTEEYHLDRIDLLELKDVVDTYLKETEDD